MNILIGCLYGVEILVCLLLALIVMLQKPKDGGLGGIAGGMSEAVFGADAGNVLIKVTVWLAAIFLVNTLVIGRLTTMNNKKTLMNDVAAPTQQQMPQLPPNPAAQLPAEPAKAATPAATPAKAPAAAPANTATPAAAPAKAATPVATPAKAPAAPAKAATPVATPAKAPAAPAKTATPAK